MAISPARLAAFDILLAIDKDRGLSSELLAGFAEQLNERDRSLSHELVLGTLRHQLYLDKLVAKISNGKKTDVEVRIALRIGLYQLIYLDRIPDYSAIDDSVELVRRAKKTSAKGFVNAILRKFTRETVILDFLDEIERISTETSHPRWLIERWIKEFGSVEALNIATANNVQPEIAFRLTTKGRKADFDIGKIADDRAMYVDGCFVAARSNDGLRRAEADGLIYFQDPASQLVASLIRPEVNQRFLDVCAAPGGKTSQIAEYVERNRVDAAITAGDIGGKRTTFLKSNCLAQGTTGIDVVRYDAAKAIPFADGAFDIVLVDAPCSGTGTIRHNPEIRYRVSANDFTGFQSKQFDILNNASKIVAYGGTLVYSTCSLEKEENEVVIERFLSSSSEFRLQSPSVPKHLITSDGYVRTFPSRDQMDGFFVAVLARSGESRM